MDQTTSVSARAAQSLERLRGDFPLEARVARASATAREVYSKILVHWLETDPPPMASEFPGKDWRS